MTSEQTLGFIKIIETALGRDKTITDLAEDEGMRKIMAEVHGDGAVRAMDGLILDTIRSMVSNGAQAVDGNGDMLSLWSWKGADGIERTEVARMRQGADVNFFKIMSRRMNRPDLTGAAIKTLTMEMIEEHEIFKEHAAKVADTFDTLRAAIEERDQLLAREFEGKDLAQIFADDLARWKAANYLEYRFDTESGTTYTVTVKRLGKGKTPGEVAADHMRRAKTWKALAKRLRTRLNKDALQQDWTLAVTPHADLTCDQERAAILIWPTCKGTFKTGETQIMGYRGTAEQVAGVAEYLNKHGLAVAWERQT